jgi:hypothetical protein
VLIERPTDRPKTNRCIDRSVDCVFIAVAMNQRAGLILLSGSRLGSVQPESTQRDSHVVSIATCPMQNGMYFLSQQLPIQPITIRRCLDVCLAYNLYLGGYMPTCRSRPDDSLLYCCLKAIDGPRLNSNIW